MRRQSVVVMLGILVFLSAATCGTSVLFSQQSRPARSERSAAKARPFAQARLLRAFRGSSEEVRHKELDNIERFHLDETGVAPALWQAIEPSLNVKQAPDSLLRAVRLYGLLDDAEKQLEAAIRGLPDDAWFEIIAYNDFEQVYRGRLAPATPGEKSGAAQFLYSLVAEGKTDIYDTLSDALQVDPNLEAILFLSDGDPNVGTIVDRPTIIQRITQQNASRRISINTIGIDARGPSEDFLKQLAADNFGEFRSSR